MASEWRDLSLGEICSFTAGSAFPKGAQGESVGKFPFIKVSDMNLSGNERYITTANNWVSEKTRYRLKLKIHPPGATVFAKIGVALTYNRRRVLLQPTVIDNNMMSAVPCNGIVHDLFLYYLLRTIDFNRIVVGTALPYINIRDLNRIPVLVPPLKEQRAIACILGALDDKIELNRRMNETLEAMARAIFKSWFVDFDPVRAKAEGQQPPGLAPHIAELFPDEFENSEIGEIPKGWEVTNVGTVAKVTSGKRPPARFSAPTDDARVPLWGGNGPMAFVSEPLYQNPILLTGRVGTLGSVFRITTPCWPSDNTLVAMARNDAAYEFLYFQLQHIDYLSLNRGSTQPLLTQTDLKSQRFVIPHENLMEQFHKVVGSVFERIDASQNESRTLAALRDTLLPKLISGELRLPDAERIIGRCV